MCSLACGALLLGAGQVSAQAGASPAPPNGMTAFQSRAVVLEVRGAIGPASADYVSRGLERAAGLQAGLVVLLLDTPGGLDASMRDIIRDILASPVPVATFVHPSGSRAASAGTYILYASHVAAMAPGTTLGAATPIALGAPGTAPDDEPADTGRASGPRPSNAAEAKAVNDAAAYIRALAGLRGRNADWAELAVREAASLPSTRALELDVIDVVADDIEGLLAGVDGREVTVRGRTVRLETAGLTLEPIPPDWRTRVLAVITNPNVALLLVMIGLYGLLFELLSPGALVPGTIGAVSLLIGLYALAVLPVNLAGALLLLLGLGLLVAEAFAPSFGVLGIGGTIALVFGLTMLFDTELPAFTVARPVIAAVVAISVGFTLLVVPAAWRAHRRRIVSGREELVGATGRVIGWTSDTQGRVLVHGERWRARASGPLVKGHPVRVLKVDGLELTVEPDRPPPYTEGRE